MSTKLKAGTATSGAVIDADTSGILELQSGSTPTTAITIDANQRSKFPTTIGVGGATPATTGSGITFPATNSPSSDANTLDDYEEGTWTPTLSGFSGGTITTTATYVKVGGVVYCSVTLSTTSSLTSTNTANFTQPFSGTAYGTGSFYCNNNIDRGVIQAVPFGNVAITVPAISGASIYLANFGWFMFVG